VNYKLAGIAIDNNFEWVHEDDFQPPSEPYVEVKDFLALDTLQAIYVSRICPSLAEWSRKQGTYLTPDSNLMISVSAIGSSIHPWDLHGATQSGGWDVWYKVDSKLEPLVKILKRIGKKEYFVSEVNPYFGGSYGDGYDPGYHDPLPEIKGWGTTGSLFIGFGHDLDRVLIIGDKKNVKELYDLLPNDEWEE